MAIIIPIKDNPNHTILIELGSTIYKLGFKYNLVGEFWTMDILDENDLVLLSGTKIVANYPLIFSHKNSFLPTGDFLCEISSANSRIIRNSFANGEAKLLYLTRTEIETL